MKTVSSGFIVINRKGEILLGKVDNHPEPFQWTVFKGKQEEGETLIETAIRELKEETGIDIVSDDRLNKNISTNYVYDYRLKHKDVYIYTLEDVEGVLNDFQFNCSSYWGEDENPEISDYKWVDIDDLEDYLFPSQRGLADFLKKHKKG